MEWARRIAAEALILGLISTVWVTYKVRQGQEADGQGSEISPHTVSVVIGCIPAWLKDDRVCYQSTVWGVLLFDFGCTGAWQEQLGYCTRFPLFMWDPDISTAELGVLHRAPPIVQLWQSCTKVTGDISFNSSIDIRRLHNIQYIWAGQNSTLWGNISDRCL